MSACSRSQIVVAGHICLDIIPTIPSAAEGLESICVPGKLTDVGPASISLGGSVGNTGLALHQLGLPAQLMGKVSKDAFGQIVLNYLNAQDARLSQGMIQSDAGQTSYSLVISPPGIDRIFLHCPGENDTFRSSDIDYEMLADAKLFHFGYPPLMRSMYENHGKELADLLRRVKETQTTTSLDMALADPNSPAGKADWVEILKATLPFVDVFLPSLDEILFMLGRNQPSEQAAINPELLKDIADELIRMGAAIVVIKLGEAGLYMQTTPETSRLTTMGSAAPKNPQQWVHRILYSPCYDADLVGTTGAGDCTIAGFLAGLMKDLSPEQVLTTAVATGACSVEAANATSGVQSWENMQARLSRGWERKPPHENLSFAMIENG